MTKERVGKKGGRGKAGLEREGKACMSDAFPHPLPYPPNICFNPFLLRAPSPLVAIFSGRRRPWRAFCRCL